MSEPYRIVIVEDNLEDSAGAKAALENGLSATVLVTCASDIETTLAEMKPDVVITDPSGLDLISTIRNIVAGVPVILVTSRPSVDRAVKALRAGANEFLERGLPDEELLAHVSRLADTFRSSSAPTRKRQTVLAIGAHPDDVEVGVGGLLAAHVDAGDSVTILTLSRGRRDGGAAIAWKECAAAAAEIGATLIFEDHVEGSEPSILKIIKRVVFELHPTIVYTHSNNDRRQDHRLVHEATVSATEEVATVACYQGSTGTVEFEPTRFVPIDGFTGTKLRMLSHFAVEEEERPGYLAEDLILATARYWSQYGQGMQCEPLEIIRESLMSPLVSRVMLEAVSV